LRSYKYHCLNAFVRISPPYEKIPGYMPGSESDWRLLFGANNQNEFHPGLSWADSQWSDHATGVGILAIKAGKVTQKTAANFVAVFTAEGKLLEMRKNVGQPFLGSDRLPCRHLASPILSSDICCQRYFCCQGGKLPMCENFT
jgi:hypothetical protein